jgi:ketosteroid isomerase-like protein
VPEESTTPPDLAEVARRFFEAANRRDFDAVMSFFASDAVWESENLGTFEGRSAIRGLWEDMTVVYDEIDSLIEENRNLGNGVTLAVTVARGRPVGSSGHVPFRFATVSVWVEDKITRFTTYTDIDQARAAAGRLAQERR